MKVLMRSALFCNYVRLKHRFKCLQEVKPVMNFVSTFCVMEGAEGQREQTARELSGGSTTSPGIQVPASSAGGGARLSNSIARHSGREAGKKCVLFPLSDGRRLHILGEEEEGAADCTGREEEKVFI